ncbi:related to dna polymerase epsilon p17 subunit [Melanopsichium pennsylvanicum]|uniref:DNA polymerase epsilon subunit D n=1 Tax=Melanopsichium pennsylvanicum TaxID=63383 RepID=A0AAJ4XPV0_9BASI|nr:related to dna polymerase epsilon p17 subunit [Melanopsichium pennsylvanicum]
MPRKSTGGNSTAAIGSTPSTPVGKTSSGSCKSLTNTTTDAAVVDSSTSITPGLTIPPSTKAVLKQQEVALKGLDLYDLPRTSVIRAAKSDLPDTVQIRKEVQSALVKSATVFVSYLTSAAHDRVIGKGGKIISATHVLEAVKELGIPDEDSMMKELKEHLKAFREGVAKKKSEKANAGKNGDVGDNEDDDEEGGDADVSRIEGDAQDDEADESVRFDEGGDGSMLRKSLQNRNGMARDNNHDEEEERDQDELMDDE